MSIPWLREKTFKEISEVRGAGTGRNNVSVALWKGSQGGSQEDIRKKGEGCVQDPEEEKAAEFSTECKDPKYNKPKTRAATNPSLVGWHHGGHGIRVAVTKSWSRTWLYHLQDV